VLRAVALVSVAVPEANAIWTDDAVRVFDSVDVAVDTVMMVVVSVDHRLVDGAPAARWADALVTTLEQPLRLLV
jgi:pyruvate/2-oxoglutarate dehydrogenase complex dihydrolipoamide acyltransferase (E2) component